MTTEEGVDPAPPAARVLAALPPVFGLHGSVGVFDSSQEEWNEYAERLMHYFVANDIVAEEKRRAILLSVVGPGTFRLLKTLASPKKLEEFMFTELVELAGVHFNPKPSPIVKRFEFNSRCQKEGESKVFARSCHHTGSIVSPVAEVLPLEVEIKAEDSVPTSERPTTVRESTDPLQ